MTTSSMGMISRRASPSEYMRWRRFMGAAKSRLSSFLVRMLTTTQATPHIDPDIRFMAMRPGTRKSM